MNKIIKMTDNEYFRADGISNSFLNQFHRSPAHAFLKSEPSPAMEFGTILHNYILEYEDFMQNYIVAPENFKTNHDGTLSKSDKTNKEWLESIPENKKVITNEILKKLQKISENLSLLLYKDRYISQYIKEGQNEIAVFFDFFDIQCKAKIDCLYSDLGSHIIFDLKKTENCLDFQKYVNNYKYYRQAYFYQKAIEKVTGDCAPFVFITAEFEEPFGVKLYELNSSYFIQAEKDIIKDIENYKKWVELGADKSIVYNREVEILQKPNWLGD